MSHLCQERTHAPTLRARRAAGMARTSAPVATRGVPNIASTVFRERAWRTHSAHDPCLTSSEGDRHHFRFIISPYDAGELGSLRKFTRELMDQASRDLRGLTGHSGR